MISFFRNDCHKSLHVNRSEFKHKFVTPSPLSYTNYILGSESLGDMGSISSTFYEQLLRLQIPEVLKRH